MPDYYYSSNPTSAHKPRMLEVDILDMHLHFETDAGVFSRNELDPGSRLLIEALPPFTGRILDLGCGWGAVGVTLSKANPGAQFVLSDVNERAVALARANILANGATNAQAVVSDGFQAIDGTFAAIVTNPPIRAGKQIIYGFFDEARNRLTHDGSLYIVIRKQQGAPSALAYLKEIYRTAEVIDRGGGYWIIRAQK